MDGLAVGRILGEEDILLISEALLASSHNGEGAPSEQELLYSIRSGARLYTVASGLVLGGVVLPSVYWVEALWAEDNAGYRELRCRLGEAIRTLAPILHDRGVTTVSATIHSEHPHREAILRIHRALGLKPHVLVTSGDLWKIGQGNGF